jgi:phosphoribosylamine-glycine ligase
MPTLLQLIKSDIGQVVSDFAKGQGKLDLYDKFAGGVRLSIPPYPLEPSKIRDVQKVSPNKGVPIRGIPAKYKDNIYFYEVMQGKSGFVHSDGSGAVLVVSDATDSVDTCLDLPYKVLEDCKVPDKQYRTDLKEVLPKMYRGVKNAS